MSHLKTKQDNEMVFEQSEYNRLLVPLIGSYIVIAAIVASALLTFIAWVSVQSPESMLYFGLEALVLIAAIVTILNTRPYVAHRRRIRDTISGLVDELEFRLGDLAVGGSFTLGTTGRGSFTATRRGEGNWLIQAHLPERGDESVLRFEGVLMKYRLTVVDRPEQVLPYNGYTYGLLLNMKNFLEAEGEYTGSVERTHIHDELTEHLHDKSMGDLGLIEREFDTAK